MLRFWGKVAVCLVAFSAHTSAFILHATSSGTVEQVSNGISTLPISPADWVSVSVTDRKAHFVEGHSIPYRLTFTGVTNGAHRVIIGWDSRNSDRHAIDYLTYFDRLLPHDQFGSHSVAETVQPLRGLSGSFGAPGTFPVPAPSGTDSPVPGQPANSFASLAASQRVFTIYNGEITSAIYFEEQSLTNTLAQTRVVIDFTASNSTVVILFGGHIAAKKDWGSGTTTSGLSASSYNMRLLELDGRSLNQSCSMAGSAVVAPPLCDFAAAAQVCSQTTNTYSAVTDVSPVTYTWSLRQNTAGATVIGSSTNSAVQVRSGNAGGAYLLQLIVAQGQLNSVCERSITVLSNTTASALANVTVCPGGNAVFSTEPIGTGPFAFVWRKDGTLLPAQRNNSLVIPGVRLSDAGVYCVEVIGPCNSATNCATLTLLPATTATPFANISRCIGDSATFSTLASGTGPFSYRWRRNGSELLGQTNRFLTIASVTTFDAGTYSAEVSGLCNSVTNSAILNVQVLPACGIAGTNAVCPFSAGNIYSGPGGMPAYRWRVSGSGSIIGPTNTLSINLAANGAGFCTLTLTVVNLAGCSSTCSRTIQVADIAPPTVTCPANITTNTEPGQCSRVVQFNVTANDNCNSTTVVCTPASGSRFMKGASTVNCAASDLSGNQATCSFTVTVVDAEKPALSCLGNLLIDNEPGLCEARVNYGVTVSDNCPGASFVCNPPSGTGFPLGTSPVTCRATDAAGNTSDCNFTVTVRDSQAPLLICSDDLLFMIDPGQCDLVVDYQVSASDNCSEVTLTCVPPTGSLFAQGVTPVNCTATDESSNRSTCSFKVSVLDSEKPVIACPANMSVAAEAGRCDAVVNFTVSASDNCGGADVVCSPASGTRFAKGITNVVCTATDAGGNTASCSFTVTVTESEKPVLTCPTDMTVQTETGHCDVVVNYGVIVRDNCPGATYECTPPSGSQLQIGTTFVTCVAHDASGNNHVSCGFNVTVQDTQTPVLHCPGDINTTNAPGRCDATIFYTLSVEDNCPGASFDCNPPSGSAFPVGMTQVSCTAFDASGNVESCTFKVDVGDAENPSLVCPATIAASTEPGKCDATVTFTISASDNCGNPTLGCEPPSGSRFAKGVTPVNCVAIDRSGNRTNCGFSVTVADREPPAPSCPGNMVLNTAPGQCGATVNFSAAVADNCSGASVACTPPSGSVFAVGTSTVNCKATDSSGNTNACSFTVTINDTEKPMITCPADLVRSTDSGKCDAAVDYAVTAADNCGSPVVSCVPPSGSRFSKGVTTVTCSARDSAGNSESCSFKITVNDIEPPAISCSNDLTSNTEAGRCDARVTYGVTAADNCPGVALTCNPPSGSVFALGVTAVRCSAADSSGNTNACGFSVTVFDREKPVLSCPHSIELAAEPGRCDALANFAITATDNCSGANVTCTPPSGSRFALGTTGVTCTAIDASNNRETCSFTVKISDLQPPTLACPTNIVANTDPGRCDTVVSFQAAVSDNCSGATVSCIPPSGSRFALGTTLVSCTAADASSNTVTCSFEVRVQDHQAPTLTCPGNIVVNTDAGQCERFVLYNATATDNCQQVNVSCVPPSGSLFGTGVTAVNCAVSDAAGNTAACQFTVSVKDAEPPALNCPGDLFLNCESNRCDALATFSANVSDNCPGAIVTFNPPSGTRFQKGTNFVTCTARDTSSNSISCQFRVIVADAQPPALICPADVYAETDAGKCDAVVTFAAVVEDNCPGAAVVCNPPSGSGFPKGVTSVLCTAADSSGNTRRCSFRVTVADHEKPVISCAGNITRNTEPGRCDAAVNYIVSASDNCGDATISCSPASGSSFAKGITTVTCTARDGSANTAACSFTVQINDAEPPQITCPSSLVLDTEPGKCGAAVIFNPAARDNCTGAAVSCTPPSGSFFNTGVTTVRCAASDNSSNRVECSFTITVHDSEKPQITCPGDVVIADAPGRCDAIVDFAATANDNCGSVTVTCVPPSGSSFAAGTNRVDCTATDAAGNSAHCSFAVIVNRTPTTATPIGSQSACVGDVVAFQTMASGTGPFTYAWRKDGTLLSGRTSNSMVISSAGIADSGTYSVEVRGACNSVTNSGTLSVRSKLAATALSDLDLCEGQTATFSTSVSGYGGPWTFAWRKNGALLAGETNSSLVLNAVAASNAGSYSLEISGPCNRVTNSATLVVHAPFTATPLANVSVCEGGSATFATGVSAETVTYTWRKDGVLISGQTNGTVVLENLTTAASGLYQVEVASRCYSATNRATLTVLSNVSITPLASVTKCVGESALFDAAASGSGPFRYTWRKDGAVAAGATNRTFIISSVSTNSAGVYEVEVAGACSTTRRSATLAVNIPITISGLANVTQCYCDPLSLNPVITGTGPLTFSWRKDGNLLPNQTNSALNIPMLNTNDGGLYTLQASGACGVVSRSATVTVLIANNPAVYTNSGVITITDNAVAIPYPSSIRVNCIPGVINGATVTLRGLTHPYPDDIDLLLVGPHGEKVMLMSDAGGGNALNNVNLTFDDNASIALPDSAQIVPGIYALANYDDGADIFPAPAPAAPYSTNLAAFIGTEANGFWSLYALDDYQIDSGAINAGWVLNLSWGPPPFRLTSPRLIGGGAYRLTLQGQPLSTYVIQSSTDLRTWRSISTNTLQGIQMDITDPAPSRQKFYRAVLP